MAEFDFDDKGLDVERRSLEQSAGFSGVCDLLVIGGGIVGAGIARDAALRGLKTVLVEQHDFASGTSSRTSRLLHGGIRYLAQGRIALVREASREKTILHRIAPHLSQPLAFIFPTRQGGPWSRWKLAIGVKVYDWLCGRNLGKSRGLSRSETLRALPGLAPDCLTGAVRYFDGLTNDARLVLDTLRSAEQQGATLLNYVRFLDANYRDGVWQGEVEQVDSQVRSHFQAKCIVNAAGPWSHQIPHSHTRLRLTKGVHLVLDHSRLPVADAVVITEANRILFVIPWGGRIILGTTDTDYHGPIASPTCDLDDLQYVLNAANDAFPHADLKTSDVLSTWAGLRPLVADPNGKPSDISRRHQITTSCAGWWDVTGGKLTTYRLMAEEAVDTIVSYLGVRTSTSACRTAEMGLRPDTATDKISDILPPVVSRETVEYFCRHEWVRHLDDVMYRRTSWRFYLAEHMAVAKTVADWMGAFLGWTVETKQSEWERYRRISQANEVPAACPPPTQ